MRCVRASSVVVLIDKFAVQLVHGMRDFLETFDGAVAELTPSQQLRVD